MQDAVLLVGPTGSGKTPLGEMLEERGLAGRRVAHFDFGAWLRRAAAGDLAGLAAAEVDFLGRVLAAGALLEADRFPLACRIFTAFLDRQQVAPGDLVVLNGLPRHREQALAMADLVRVETLVELECTAAAVRARIRGNLGGDRTGRSDDDPAAVERKLAIYAERTRSLVDHYRRAGARIVKVEVTAATGAEEVWRRLEEDRGSW